MQSTNSLKKITDISIYKYKLDNTIYKNFVFIDLMNKLIQNKIDYKYRFAIYTDISLISDQIFIPIFHTIYLGSSSHNVIIDNSSDIWLTQTFKNNKYFIIPKEKDDFNYSPYNITVIDSIEEIL